MLVFVLAAALTPQREWIDRLALIVPAERTTRWLLLVDAVCLVLLGLQRRHPGVAVALALAGGFLALNVIGMILTDFFLGLAVFHLGVAITAAALRRGRWSGILALVVVLALGALT